MNKNLTTCIFCFVIALLQIACKEPQKYHDDRIVDHPAQDSILDELIATSMMVSNLNINPDKPVENYYITFNYFIENDSTKVWVMGNYNRPFVFHDTQGHDVEKFMGYFRRNNSYCLFYQDIFGEKTHDIVIEALHTITKDWKIQKEPRDLVSFPEEIGYQDPYIFEYCIDENGHYKLSKEGFF